MSNETIVLNTHNQIQAFRLLVLRAGLKMEAMFPDIIMKHDRRASVLVRQATGLKTRNKKMLLMKYETWLRERGILR